MQVSERGLVFGALPPEQIGMAAKPVHMLTWQGGHSIAHQAASTSRTLSFVFNNNPGGAHPFQAIGLPQCRYNT